MSVIDYVLLIWGSCVIFNLILLRFYYKEKPSDWYKLHVLFGLIISPIGVFSTLTDLFQEINLSFLTKERSFRGKDVSKENT